MDMETQVLQALARGYCHPENSGKVVDPDLIKAMAKEIIESFSPRPDQELKEDEMIAELEKIEPMKIAFIGDAFGQQDKVANKLNEVIEKVNLIMEVINKEGK